MTDEQIITKLAKREKLVIRPHYYLTSRDALAPVLEKLSEIERITLQHRLNTRWAQDRSDKTFAFWLLTLPPRDLARAIAEAMEEDAP